MAKVAVENLEKLCLDAMARAGLASDEAKVIADILVTTDTWGVHTHGTKQLRGLMKNFRDGKMELGATAELIGEGPSWALFDGHRSNPMVTSQRAMSTAISKARTSGIAVSCVRESGHFGAAGYYANMAAREGMIGISMCNVDAGVAVPGSKGAVLGTNPIAYAVPTGRERTIFLDIATSVVAASKVFAAKANGKAIPTTWLLDGNGIPTSNPNNYPAEGALLPMAGHKGYGIALLVEIVTGVLSGGAFGQGLVSWLNGPEPVNQSFTFIAVDVASFSEPSAFFQRIQELSRQITTAPRAPGEERIYLPGDKEWDNRERALRDGIELPEDVIESLRGLAEDLSVEASWLSDA